VPAVENQSGFVFTGDVLNNNRSFKVSATNLHNEIICSSEAPRIKLAKCPLYVDDDDDDNFQSVGATNTASPPKFSKTHPAGRRRCCSLLLSLSLLLLLLHNDGDKYSANTFGSGVEANLAR